VKIVLSTPVTSERKCEGGVGVLTLQGGQKSRSRQQVRKRKDKTSDGLALSSPQDFKFANILQKISCSWPRATTATVGWSADRTGRERSKWCTYPLWLLCTFL